MMKNVRGTMSPMSKGVFKRVFGVLVVLLIASVLLVGAGSADTVDDMPQDALEAINTATGPTIITLPAGTYKFPVFTVSMQNKNITFNSTEGAVIDVTFITSGNGLGNLTNAELTFDNVTVNWIGDENYQGLANAKKVVYKNCTINGLQYLYGDADFIDCTLENEQCWSVWTYGAKNVKFEGCIFNTGGHAVLNYNEDSSGTFVAKVNFTDCTFNNSGLVKEPWGPEQLVENGLNPSGTNTYILNFTNCQMKGDGKQLLWGNKNAMDDDHLSVTINGVKQTLIYKIIWDVNGEQTYQYVTKGDTPKYSGETPTKADTNEYKYQFTGWTPELEAVTTAATYTATFAEIPKEVTPDLDVETTTETNGKTVVTVKNEDIDFPDGNRPAVQNPIQATKVIITSTSGVNITLIYADNDNADATTDGTNTTVTGNITKVIAEYPKTNVESGVAGVTATYELTLNLKNETVKNGEIPLPTIKTTLDADVKTAIGVQKGGNGEKFELLAMIQAEYAGGIDKVNNNLTGDEKIKLTFVVPASAGTDLAAFHIKDGQEPELLDENCMEIKPNTPDGYTTIILTVDGFSGYAIAKVTYPVVQQQTPSSSSSHSQGSSVWLTETQTPTATPTPTETAQPTDTVPTDIPVTQPTSEPASPGFGILAALAGLGAVAALRRR